jgi:geranylgeranyl diphosphate synthase type I
MRDELSAAYASERAGVMFSLLVLLSSQASGGTVDAAVPAAAAWRALHIALKLCADPTGRLLSDGVTRRPGADPPLSATEFVSVARRTLLQLDRPPAPQLDRPLHTTLARIGAGPPMRSRALRQRPADRQRSAIRTSRFFALGTGLGASCATTEPTTIRRYQLFGRAIGMLIQLVDDLRGLRRPARQTDIALGRRTLPIAYALAVASPPERMRLNELLIQAGHDRQAEIQAHQLIVALGAELYALTEIARYRRQALAELDGLVAAADAAPLQAWIAHVQRAV